MRRLCTPRLRSSMQVLQRQSGQAVSLRMTLSILKQAQQRLVGVSGSALQVLDIPLGNLRLLSSLSNGEPRYRSHHRISRTTRYKGQVGKSCKWFLVSSSGTIFAMTATAIVRCWSTQYMTACGSTTRRKYVMK